jgi:hypothetical protein
MKHLSFVETGRSKPSPEMVLHLAHHLDIPLRERNDILLAAGYAPRYRATNYEASPDNEQHAAISQILEAHTLPAVVVDGGWNLVAANDAAVLFLLDVDPKLLEPPVNVVRLSLHRNGLAKRVVNFAEYAAHVLNRIEQIASHNDNPTLRGLLDEFAHLRQPEVQPRTNNIVLPLEMETPVGVIRLFSTIATFGAPYDVNLAEIAIETFYPADPESRERLVQLQA